MKVGILDDNSKKYFAGLTEQSVMEGADVILGVSLKTENGKEEGSGEAAAGIFAVKLYGTDADVLDFYVAPEYRNRGAGTALLRLWNELAYNAGVDSVVFSYDREENAELDEFLEGQDAVLSDNLEVVYSFQLEDVSEQVKKGVKSEADMIPLKDISNAEFEQANELLYQLSVKEKSSFCEELSFVAKIGKKICAVILVSKTEESYTIDALGVLDKASVKELMGVLHECYEKLIIVCDAKEKIFVRAINVEAVAFISKITDGKAVEENHIVSRYIAY